MREGGIQIHFHDHAMMVGRIDTYYDGSNARQAFEDILEDADFEVVDEEEDDGRLSENS